jgi:hypothetical protein
VTMFTNTKISQIAVVNMAMVLVMMVMMIMIIIIFFLFVYTCSKKSNFPCYFSQLVKILH